MLPRYAAATSTKVYDGDVPEDTTNPLDHFDTPDGSPGENRSLFYHDANQNGQYDAAEDIWKDEVGGTAAQYDAGTDTLVYRGTDGAWQLQGGEAGAQAGLLYHDADRSGFWDAAEDIFVETANPEPHSISADPVLASGKYFTNSPTSPIVAAGTAGAGGVFCIPDAQGWLRHVSMPTIGAYEYVTETTTATFGRITTRNLNGRTYHYAYCADGHIASYTDDQDASNNASYEYDHLGRRIRMTVGNSVTRMVYDGDDVVAEYVDENGDGTVDRKRVYWILPVIDQRIGFVDIDVETGAKKFYYYLTDQVGSVMQVVDDAGTVVNQYDYDAFGNLNTDGSFETVPNRYRFQGREWDAHRGDYYFRNRTYIPEHGSFTGPDPRAEIEPNGPCNHLLAGNNPLRFTDPTGENVVEEFLVWLGIRAPRPPGWLDFPREWVAPGGGNLPNLPISVPKILRPKPELGGMEMDPRGMLLPGEKQLQTALVEALKNQLALPDLQRTVDDVDTVKSILTKVSQGNFTFSEKEKKLIIALGFAAILAAGSGADDESNEKHAPEKELKPGQKRGGPGEPPAADDAAQMKKLSPGEIDKLQEHGIHPHDLKPNSQYDLFKDKKGNIYVKPKDGTGPGEPTGINVNDI